MALTPKQKQYFASKAQNIPALLQIGKNGITNSFAEELERMSKKKGLVKIKFLKSYVDTNKTSTQDFKEELKKLALESKTELIKVIGNTAIYFNPQAREEAQKLSSPK